MHFTSSLLAAVLPSLALAICLTFLILRLSSRLPWLARASSDRLHVAPTPVWGGIAIFVSFMGIASAHGLFASQLGGIAASGCGMFLLGLADDIWKLRPRWKLAGEIICLLTPISLVIEHPLTGNTPLDLAIAALWMLGITNAFNLLDNINGLSAGTAVLVSALQAAFSFHSGNASQALVGVIFGSAVLGFLVFNFPGGRIFMGDSGSLFIGYWLAAMTLCSIQSAARTHLDTVLFLLLLMIIPICDTTLVTLTRFLNGRPVSVGGTDHISHRLMAYGFTPKSTVLFLWTVTLLSGMLGLLAASYKLHPLSSIIILLAVTVTLFGTYLTRFELQMHKGAPRAVQSRPRVAGWVRVFSRAVFDLALIAAAYYTAYLLRFDGQARGADYQLFISTITELALIKLAVFVAFGAYRAWWDYFGLKDAYRLVAASAVASLTAVTYFSAVYRFSGFSRVVIALDFLIFTMLCLLSRFSFRFLDEVAPANHKTNVFIYGANAEGETALQFVSKHYRFRVVGFLDDDHGKRDFSIHSVPIRGSAQDMAQLCDKWQARALLLTPSTPEESRLRLLRICQSAGVKALLLRIAIDEFDLSASLTPPSQTSIDQPLIANSAENLKVLTKTGSA